MFSSVVICSWQESARRYGWIFREIWEEVVREKSWLQVIRNIFWMAFGRECRRTGTALLDFA